MASNGIPASDAVRAAETAIRRAACLREEAKRILEQAEAIERNALKSATDLLGERLGRAAFGLAEWTVTGEAHEDGEIKQPEAATGLPAMPPSSADGPPPPDPVLAESDPAPSAEILPSARAHHAASRTEMHGVEVPPSRVNEAEDIVSQARSAVAQGKKANPFASDRGKNAWRKSLFKAAWDSLASAAAAAPAGSQQVHAPSPAQAEASLPDGSLPVHPTGRGLPIEEEMSDLDQEEFDQPQEADDGLGGGDAKSAAEEIKDDDESAFLSRQALPEAGAVMEEAVSVPDPEPAASDIAGAAPALPSEAASGPARQAEGPLPKAAPDFAPPRVPAEPVQEAPQEPHDPLDDLDELPPPSKLPPPRGYQTAAHADPMPVAPPRPASPQTRAAPAPVKPPEAPGRPAPVRAAPQQPPAMPVSQLPEKSPGIAMHTPVPVPSTRRPGIGQVLQRPQQIGAPPAARPGPPASPARPLPPSFLKR